MLTNDIKEGMEIIMTQGRVGFMRDNKKGIVRTVEVKVPGQGTDVGSCYIYEIRSVKVNGKWEHATMTEAHEKQLAKIGWAI